MSDPVAAGRVTVINPNSSTAVTGAIAHALAGLAGPAAALFDCRTIAEGPPTIVTDRDVADAGDRVAELAATLAAPAAIVIACFSDPGLAATRERVRCPVIGLQQAAVLTALAIAPRFGIIALSATPIPRHRRRLAEMGVLDRLAHEVGLSGVSAYDAGHDAALYPEIVAAGRDIVAAGAGAVILGCAGFGPRRLRLEQDLGVPVIDPVLAAGAMALALVPI